MSESRSSPEPGGHPGSPAPTTLSSPFSAAPEIRPQIIMAPEGAVGSFQSIQQTTEITVSSGLVPPPDVIRAYGEIDPAFPRQIMGWAESEIRHRQGIERELLAEQVAHAREMRSNLRLGQWLGFMIAVLGLSASIWATLSGHDWVGGVIGGTTVISLVVVFVTGRPHMHAGAATPEAQTESVKPHV